MKDDIYHYTNGEIVTSEKDHFRTCIQPDEMTDLRKIFRKDGILAG